MIVLYCRDRDTSISRWFGELIEKFQKRLQNSCQGSVPVIFHSTIITIYTTTTVNKTLDAELNATPIKTTCSNFSYFISFVPRTSDRPPWYSELMRDKSERPTPNTWLDD